MRKVFGGVLSALLLAGLAAAQKMTVTGGGVLQVGQPIQVTYSDPSRAGQTVSVRVDNCNPDQPTVQTVSILLDAQGNGLGQWTVLNWWSVAFNAPGVREIMCCVIGPGDGN